LLPGEVPHSPQRPAGTVGLVVERRRGPGELDGFSWYCATCGNQLYLERLAVRDIVTDLPQVFSRFYSSLEHRTCRVCGSVLEPPSGASGRASTP
jgi:3-hydroxyanthranilate 3,4-dioxygenase